MSHAGTRLGEHTGIGTDRFVIRAKLGGGGMGEVYLAEDTLLKRSVALKLIRREHDDDSAYAYRLRREAERASQLNHPNIASVYDLLEEQGRLCLVMEYVKGQTLRSKLHESVSLEEFFVIAGQCLEAVAAAHRCGVLHCDLKPENVMFSTQGQLKILDFGFARTLPDSHTLDELTTTSLGGTPGYMAPEVLLGAAPDRRSDIFSLGVIFYEMLAGQHPFRLDKQASIAGAILRSGPPPLPNNAPDGIEAVVFRMLAKDHEQRYQRCEDALADFNAVRRGKRPRLGRFEALTPRRAAQFASLAGGVIIALLLGLHVRTPWQANSVQASMSELAILPFAPAAPDSNSRAFASGLTETLAARLGEITDRYPIQVVAPSEVRAQNVSDARHARTLLGANLVLEGSLQESSGVVRILYNLVDTKSLHQLHSGVITADTSNIFAVQDRVIDEVLKSLNIELAQEDRGAINAHGTSRPAAYDAYLRGRGYLQGYDRPDNIQNAISEFLRSLQADPRFGLAYAGLGQAYLDRYALTHSPVSLDSASAACRRAAELNPKHPDGEVCLGMLATAGGQFGSAAQHLERALQLDPARQDIYRELAIAYEGDQRSSDAEELLKKEVAVRPESWSGYEALGWFYAQHGRYENAVEQFKRVIDLAPASVGGYSNLGAVYVQQGKYPDAVKVLERSIQIQPTAAALNNLGAAYFYQRKYADSARVYELAAQMTPDDYTVFGNLGEAYGEIQEKQEQSRADYTQALKLAQQRLQASPEDGDALLSAGLYSAGLGQVPQAERYRRAGIKVLPNSAEARFTSAQVLARIQRDDAALAELARALQLGLSQSEIRDDPQWDRFSEDPKFQVLMTAQNKH